jgi:hypothetical protein
MGAQDGPKRKADDATSPDMVSITPLGAGQEVGRSCIIVRYLGKTVMLDCGIHPGYSGLASLPFFDEVDMEEVDVMLVTHFHLDHCAAVPYVTGHTRFKGRVFMTHPTKAIVHTLLKDFVKVSRGDGPAGEPHGGAVQGCRGSRCHCARLGASSLPWHHPLGAPRGSALPHVALPPLHPPSPPRPSHLCSCPPMLTRTRTQYTPPHTPTALFAQAVGFTATTTCVARWSAPRSSTSTRRLTWAASE